MGLNAPEDRTCDLYVPPLSCRYGDSHTADIRDSRSEVWDKVFPPDEIRAQPLGMGGSTVEVCRSMHLLYTP